MNFSARIEGYYKWLSLRMPQIFSFKNDSPVAANTAGTNHCFAAVAKKIKQPIIKVTRLIRVKKIYHPWLNHRLSNE